MLIKPDSRRRIDGLIDYFGGGRSAQDADRERRLDDRLARDRDAIDACARPTRHARLERSADEMQRGAVVRGIAFGKARPNQALVSRLPVRLTVIVRAGAAREQTEPVAQRR